MKLKQLSAAIMATSAFASMAYAQVPTVYGKVNASLQAIESEELGLKSQDNWEMLSNASRIGVKGDLPINDSLKAIYKLEYELFVDEDKSGDGGSNFKQRNTYVGLQGNFGTTVFGRHDTPTKLAQGEVDRFNDLLVGDIKYVMAGEQRENNIVIYSTPKFADAIAVNIAFMPGEDEGYTTPGTKDSEADDGLADHISASVTYTTDILYLALATDRDVDNTDLIRLVGELSLDMFKVGAIYQTAEESDSNTGGMGGLSGWGDFYSDILDIEEQDAYLVSGEVTLGDVVLKAQYSYSESTHIGNVKDTEITQMAIGADYKLSKASKLFAYYANIEAENTDAGDDSEDNTIGVGYELKF